MKVITNGGLAFLIAYGVLNLVIGAPLLMLEMTLGQYSGLPNPRIWHHLCPLLGGLGGSMIFMSLVKGVLELAVLTWSGQALFHLFYHQEISDKIFNTNITMQGDAGLRDLGELNEDGMLVLGVICVIAFMLVAASTKATGKITSLLVPVCYMLAVALLIRVNLSPGGPQGILTLLKPQWETLKDYSVWLEAGGQVVFSLHLGLGVISSYSANNPFQHNIIRDGIVLTLAHFIWILITTLLTCSLLGLGVGAGRLPSEQVIIGQHSGGNIWLAGITMLEICFQPLSQDWLWAGLYFILICLVSLTSLFGFIELIASSLVSLRPHHVRWQPLASLLVLAGMFLVGLLLVTNGGIEVYHLLLTYVSNWPALLMSLLMVIAAVCCHGTKYLIRDLKDMSKIANPHWITSHLSVSYYTTLPLLLLASLGWSLYSIALDHLESPLSHFKISLEEGPYWSLPLAWSLTCLPPIPIILGILLGILWFRRGVPISMHFKRLCKPTDRWYQNEHLETLTGTHLTGRKTSSTA